MKKILCLVSAGLLLIHAGPLFATPYASGISNNAGTVSFFLNEDSDNVKVLFNSGTSTNDLGVKARGRYSFTLGANTNFTIQVSKASGAGYKSDNGSGGAVKLQISSATNRYLNFENPRGIKINRNPNSRYFGRIYTSNTRTNATSSNLVRPMGVGIYMINPDQTSAHLSGQEDSPLRPANWPMALNTGSSGNTFPYDLAIGPDDNVYAADWTDSSGNVWITDPEAADPGSGVLKLLSFTGAAATPVGVDNTHGSINAVYVEGSVATADLKVWTIDEDLQTDKTTGTGSAGTELNSLWRYDINGNSLPYQLDATKVWTASGKQGIATSDQTCDMVRGTNGNFYITTARSAGNESGLAVVNSAGAPLWNSWTASQDIRAGVDIMSNSVKVALSPDHKTLAVSRSGGLVWILPLTNGVPDISKRLALQPFGSLTKTLRGLAFDSANNLYVSTSSDELVGIFSPGGTSVASTSNDSTGTNGSFSISVPATTISVNATIANITENGGTNGVFTITRAGDNSVAITVPYTVAGTATNGVDYVALSGSVVLPAFVNTTNIFVTPINDSIPELTETVTLTLQGGAGFSVGSPGGATVNILDDETPTVSFDAVATKTLLESYSPSKAVFQITRRGLLTPALSVNLAYSGTATLGADYNGPSTVSFGSGASTASVTLTPINDQIFEGNETAIVTTASGVGYVAGATPATAVIIDDEYPHGTLLFSDNFETDSSALWRVNVADNSDAFVDFAYDYSQVGIPPAPGGAGTKGMRFRCGNTLLEIDAISASPLSGNFTGDYRLKFDMWINYNGPMPDGGAGSTQNFDAGVGTEGDIVVWVNNPSSDGIWFSTTGDGADGNTGGDYDAFIGPDVQNDDTGFYAAGVGAPNSGVRDNAKAFYSLWGGQAAPAAQLALFPGQTGVANIGNAGMAWHTVVISKIGNTVAWAMDGVTIANVTNNTAVLSTNIFVGYQDLFSSGSISDNPAMSFGLVDNLRVEAITAANISITSITTGGGNVQIDFTAGATDIAGAFTLQSSASVAATPLDVSATITQLSPGVFRAVRPQSGAIQFYRVRR